ncbi:MAG: hypothetical protein APF81_05970 [Desulfosporosinus sp. BRH_c37]|nr:MAG: hypothetical protein APF81_05970 [Desulfosporosinus sp. BRH_c37]
MRSWKHKTFRDNVHGYIKIPIPFVKIIDSEIFQRLRNIEQTGMRVLYPSARHDRFIHSLGTYYLGVKAFKAFRENVKLFYSQNSQKEKNHYNVIENENLNEKFWDKNEVLFSIACLLHDCGHAPFSHTFEHIYDLQKCNDSSNNCLLNVELLQEYNSVSFKNDFGLEGKGKEHERMSAFLVKHIFYDTILNIISGEFETCSDEDIEFIARIIIGCKYGAIANKENQIKNCMIELMNSESIDVDGLDYIIRDSKLSGVDTVSVDTHRLINSLTIVEKTHFKNCKLKDLEFNHVLLNAELQGTLNGNIFGGIFAEDFEGSIKGQICISGRARIANSLNFNGGYVLINLAPCKTIPETVDIVNIELETNLSNYIDLESAKFKSLDRLKADIKTTNDTKFRMNSVFYSGRITGNFTGQVLGCFCEEGTTVEIVLAFHKSSLSVLQNVIYARNYEYQWIYGHHKVAYYSNFLLVHALRQSVKFLIDEDTTISTDDILTKIVSMRDKYEYKGQLFYRSNDSDIISLFKYCFLRNQSKVIPNNDLNDLYEELFTRNYKKSVWKSYAEYNVFFSDLSDGEKSHLIKTLEINSNSIGTNKLYGFFSDEWNHIFKGFNMFNVVWVSSDVKIKELDLDKTFILLKEETMRLRDVTIDNALNSRKAIYFYLYYWGSEQDLTKSNLKDLIEFLKQKARENPRINK